MMARYLKEHLPGALLLALCALVTAGVFALYGLPVEPVGYAAFLCMLLLTGALLCHHGAWRRRRRERQRVLRSPALLLESLPPPASLAEEDDRAIMEALRQELQQAQTELQRFRRDSQDYFTAWVHQIKTPLSVMQLELQDDPRHRPLLNQLFSMGQYVDMALSYARLNSATKDLVLRQTALDGVIRSVIREFAPLLIAKRIAIHYGGCVEAALTDEGWLRFMLEQAMSNAAKYTHAGSVTVTVEAGPAVIIADTGIGVAPEDVPRIFEKGYTGCNGRSGQKSTGLGLYLCRQAAEMLGHRVSLTSRVGEGTAIRFELGRAEMGIE